MGKPTGFKEFDREVEPYRDSSTRVIDFKEIYTPHNEQLLVTQGADVWTVEFRFANLRVVVPSIT